MNTFRNNPDGEENQRATKESASYIGGLKLKGTMSEYITKEKFRAWVALQPNDREWNYMSILGCVVCSFIKETAGETIVVAGGCTFDVGDEEVNHPIPSWLASGLESLDTTITGSDLKAMVANLTKTP